MGVKWIHKGGKSRPDKRTLPRWKNEHPIGTFGKLY